MVSSSKVGFNNSFGQMLAGQLTLPDDGVVKVYAIFAHCFTCGKSIKVARYIADQLASKGVAVLRFDFTGLNESEGDFSQSNFSSNVDDLVSAAEYLESNYQPPQLLIGHSLGGAAVLQAVDRIVNTKAVVTIGAPSRPDHVLKMIGDQQSTIAERGEAEVVLAGRPFTIRQQFLDDLAEQQMGEKIRRLGRALLVMHSPVDEIVGVDNAGQIFQAAMHPKSFISLDHADHFLSRQADATYAAEVIASWASRYLPVEEENKETEREKGKQVLVSLDRSRFRTEINARGHVLVADEPLAEGGTNHGPNPYDLLLSALGACTAMTLRMYADLKKWPLEQINVVLRHEKIHCQDCENTKNKIDQIERDITVKGELTGAQQRKLLEIANKCPVHRTLHSDIQETSSIKIGTISD